MAQGLLDYLYESAQKGASLLAPNSEDVKLRQQMPGLLADFTPVLGDAKSVYDGVQSARQGNYGEAALNGLGLLPFVPSMAGMIKAKEPFTFLRNTVPAPRPLSSASDQFAQKIEPTGRFMLEGTEYEAKNLPQGWISGKHTFNNPLFIDWGSGGYKDADNWKQVLSSKYGGKTGKALSAAIAKDGYDGIVTLQKGETSEVVDLTHLFK